ncbi:O-methyltransferase [Flavihumibacter stibioxidans]|uniref:Methyltransferase n=1 Tax=Flavihumibacter stibioxidans TaxID=1834163 RepID=A0ABR7M657_9BACT|nr:methyltransferase [Flavihumibacter stibioxidans]
MLLEPISPEVNAYAEKYSSPEPPELQEIAADTTLHHPQYHMLSGHLQGRFLSLISKLLAPKYILEIGTFTGYSALCLSEGLAEGGELHTIELREADAATAQGYFSQSPRSKQIFLHLGEAAKIIPTLDREWDLVFIDADKTGYLDYYEMVLPRLRKGGLIMADNVLFHGQVLENPVKGKNARAIQAFNECIKDDPRVEKLMLTLRDGLFLLRKK